jgi:ATP-binding cassette, subfamily C, bacterial
VSGKHSQNGRARADPLSVGIEADRPGTPADRGLRTPGDLRLFLRAMLQHDPRRLVRVILLQLAASLTQGVAALLLVPMLELAGVGHSASRRGLLGLTRRVFAVFGLKLTLTSMLIVYVGVVAAAAALNAYQTVELTRYRLTSVDALRRRLYSAVAGAEWRHLLRQRQSDIQSVLTVNVALVSQGTAATLNLSAAVLVIAVQVAVAMRISLPITALAAVTGLALTALVWPLVIRSRRLGQMLVLSNRQLLGSVTAFLDGLKLAKAHRLATGHVATFDADMRRSRNALLDFIKASQLAGAMQLIVSALVLAVLVWVSVRSVHVPLAELLVLAYIFNRLVPLITSAQNNVQLTAQALPAMEELLSFIIDGEAAAEPPTPGPDGLERRLAIGRGIRLDGVGFAYADGAPEQHEALDDVSFEIAPQQTTALVGPSGAGKTTLADLIVGLITPGAGTITVDARPLVGVTRARWRQSIAIAPQDPFLFHDTIRENLLWARPAASEQELWSVLELAAAATFVQELPAGLDTIVGDRGGRVSGGERQRIALARALLRGPELLVLDEATSSLDTEHELAIRNALAVLHGRITLLVIAHRLSTVRHADSIVVLDRGRVVETGTWEELSERDSGRLKSLISAGAII